MINMHTTHTHLFEPSDLPVINIHWSILSYKNINHLLISNSVAKLTDTFASYKTVRVLQLLVRSLICQALAVTRMTSTSSWKSLQKPRQSTTIVKLPVNTAFPNPWLENGETSNILFTGELRMTAKRASMGCYRPKDPELDQQLADWFSDQRSQGKHFFVIIFVSSSI